MSGDKRDKGETEPVDENWAVLASLRSLPLHQSAWDCAHGEASFPQAGVLVALTAEADPRVVLGRRAKHLSLHPGEIAFAGGKREVTDASPWATALREANEEVGLLASDCRAIGELDPLITRTGFQVYPCIAEIPAQTQLTVDAAEFDSVLLPRLHLFAQPETFQLKTLSDGEHLRRVPFYEIGEDSVWGVTAAILAQLVNVAYDAGFDLQRDWKQKP